MAIAAANMAADTKVEMNRPFIEEAPLSSDM
jgi:hypothetical protein